MGDIFGAWVDPKFDSSLIARIRGAWNKPLRDLSRVELATFLEQGYPVEDLLPIAKRKLEEPDDDTEFFAGQLAKAIERASNTT